MGVILVRSVATASSMTVIHIRDMTMMRLRVIMVLDLVIMAAARGFPSGNVTFRVTMLRKVDVPQR